MSRGRQAAGAASREASSKGEAGTVTGPGRPRGARLDRSFFEQDTRIVARRLLGARLCNRLDDGKVVSARIVETEAYHGFDDQASHARNGPTPRTAVMFGPAGHAYVYICYGIHHLLNFVTREEGFPAAVLIRGVDEPEGFGDYAIGPGRLCKAMGVIRRKHDGLDVTDSKASLWVESGGRRPVEKVETSARVGVDYAGDWARKPWRYYLSEALSPHRPRFAARTRR